MITFTHYNKFIKVKVDGKELPSTLIQCEENSPETVLKVCQEWLDALGLTDTEYQVLIRAH